MSTRLKKKYEKLDQTIGELAEESANGTLIVVEGKKDQQALRSLEILGPILTAKTGGKTFAQTAQEIAESNPKEVILLLDFDRRGKEGINRLKQDLEKAKITPNLKFWQDLSTLLKNDVQCIESIPAYLQTLQAQAEPL